jgi:hypothetical protein
MVSPELVYWNGYPKNAAQPEDAYGQLRIAIPTLDSSGKVISVEVGVYYTVTSRSMGDIY